MGTEPLTKSQQRVVQILRDFIEEHSYPPSLKELADLLEVNINAVRDRLMVLSRKGVLRLTPNVSRGIELLDQKLSGIPIYGYVPAGHPFMSQENIVDTFETRKYISASDRVFGLYVRGDSMKEANLATDDLIFVDPDEEPRNGRMVVALVEGEPTVKWFQKKGETIMLVPANAKYKTIVVKPHDENFKIVGVVIAMMRSLDKKRIDNAMKLRKAS
jgi:repressor LexA